MMGTGAGQVLQYKSFVKAVALQVFNPTSAVAAHQPNPRACNGIAPPEQARSQGGGGGTGPPERPPAQARRPRQGGGGGPEAVARAQGPGRRLARLQCPGRQ
uniref:Uncharacterized protein n=1 Tax=Arundo donax TaxID=35708 RepID=A0A0A9H770_ARUDO